MNSKDNFTKKLKNRLMGKDDSLERKPVSIPPLGSMLKQLMSIQEEDWAKYAFRREPIRGRFTEEEKKVLAKNANTCGVEYANAIKEKYANLSMRELAKELGIELQFPDKPNGGGHIIFAQFVEPNKITVFQDSVKKAEGLIREHNLSELFVQTPVEDILLAHEIFHYIEEQNKQEIYTRTKSICLWKIGSFQYKSKISCLGEIAGMAFAKAMLDLPFSPYVLDSFLVYAYNKEASYYLYEEIMKIAGAE